MEPRAESPVGIGSPVPVLRVFDAARRAPFARPGIQKDAPGGPTLDLSDPFGNQLRF